jgi:hypothetical protein
LESFRTSSKDETLFNAENLHSLNFPGDNKLDEFYQRWREIIGGMKPQDVPSKETLRDSLVRKLKSSNRLQLDLKFYDHMDDQQNS